MFERTRANLLTKLEILEPRFGQIGVRAVRQSDEARAAIKMGFGGSAEPYLEIADKAFEQAALCRQSITALALRRAWPLMFRRGAMRAEKFATLCESILDDADAGAAAGRAAFRKQYGVDTYAQD